MEKLTKKQIGLLILLVIIIIVLIVTMILFKLRKEEKVKDISTSVGETEKFEYEVEPKINETTGITEEIAEVHEEEGDTSWDEENVEETKVNVEEEKKEKNVNKNRYYIKINYTANCITIYEKDSSGEYNVPVKALICSTGTATPRGGVYKMGEKYRWHQLNGGVYGQYCTRITGHILFHSVPYATNSPDSLKYVAYDKLGTKASAGCVRLTTEGAIWIYSNCPSGTYVEFYSSSDPGPLGKPSAQKITSNVKCRNWDPTDPTEGNPWHTYKEEKEELPEKQEQKIEEIKQPEIKEQKIEEIKKQEIKEEKIIEKEEGKKTEENIQNTEQAKEENEKKDKEENTDIEQEVPPKETEEMEKEPKNEEKIEKEEKTEIKKEERKNNIEKKENTNKSENTTI